MWGNELACKLAHAPITADVFCSVLWLNCRGSWLADHTHSSWHHDPRSLHGSLTSCHQPLLRGLFVISPFVYTLWKYCLKTYNIPYLKPLYRVCRDGQMPGSDIINNSKWQYLQLFGYHVSVVFIVTVNKASIRNISKMIDFWKH